MNPKANPEQMPATVTAEMISAAMRAMTPHLNEDGHLDSLSARSAVAAAVHAALQVYLQPKVTTPRVNVTAGATKCPRAYPDHRADRPIHR